MTKVIIIHGNSGGTGEDQWIPWLASELEQRGFAVQHPTFPDNEEAKRSIWIPYLESLGADEETILVGWSSGAVAAMRYAEDHKIKASVLVAPCYTDLGDEKEKISGWYDDPWQWDVIKQNQQWIAQFSSRNDPVIPITEARHVQKMLDTEYKEYAFKFHFGWPVPMPQFPDLLRVVLHHESLALE